MCTVCVRWCVQAMLAAADASMQKELAAREAALKKQVEGQMTALALGAMNRVKSEAKAVKEAHDALAAALAAHQVEPPPRILASPETGASGGAGGGGLRRACGALPRA